MILPSGWPALGSLPNLSHVTLHVGYRSDIVHSYTSRETLNIRYAQLTPHQVPTVKEIVSFFNKSFSFELRMSDITANEIIFCF